MGRFDALGIECIAKGFRFTEGPAWNPVSQTLVFSDIIGDGIFRWRKGEALRRLRGPANMPNGNTWDREGRLLTCEHATSQVTRTGADGCEVLVSQFTGRALNSPNDIVVREDGSIWFTDPDSGRSAPYGVARDRELDFFGVYRFEPRSGELTLLVSDFARPNGLCFSLDQSRLFINDTFRQHIRAFEVADDGKLSGGEVWASVAGEQPGVADGMKFDAGGNLYCCGSGGIHVFDPDGRRIQVIELPEVPANFTWGGRELDQLFATARTSVYRVELGVVGYQPCSPAADLAPQGEEEQRV